MGRKLLVFLLLLIAANASVAQDRPELFSRIERTFKEKQPRWKIERIIDGQTSDPRRESISFRAGRQQAAVDVRLWKRLEDAREDFAESAADVDRTRGKWVVKKRLANVGDENYIWTNRGSVAWPILNFRQGNIYVSIYAPSILIAKQFARRVLENL